MTEWRIVHVMPDGSVLVTTPADKARPRGSGVTGWLNAVEIHARAAGSIPPEAVQIAHHRASELPDRADRAAWRISPSTGKVHVDQVEAARLAAEPKPLTLDERMTILEAKQR